MTVIASGRPMTRLRRIYHEVETGRGAVAFVHGPASSGKTTLLNELVRSARVDGATVLHASCSIFDRANTLSVARQLLCPEFMPGQPFVTHTAGRPFHAEVLGKIDRAVNGVHRRSAGRTVVICVDDVRYADAASRLFVEQLAASIHHRPVLLVLADRSNNSEPPSGWNESALTGIHWISLTALSAQTIRELAFDTFTVEVSDVYAEAVHRLSNGNWLLASALLADHVSNRNSQHDTGNATPVVGREYRQAVLRSLHGHDPEVREIAEVLALTGGSVRTELVAEIAGIDTHSVEHAAGELTSCGLLGDCGFRHPAAQEAVLSTMSRTRRQSLSRRAAAAFQITGVPVEEVARWLAAVDTVDNVLFQSAISADATSIDDVIAQLTVAGPTLAGGSAVGRLAAVPRCSDRVPAGFDQEAHTLWHARSAVADLDEAIAAFGESVPQCLELVASRMLVGCEFPSLVVPVAAAHPTNGRHARLDAAWALTGVLLGSVSSATAADVANRALPTLAMSPDGFPAAWAALSALVHARQFDSASSWCDRILSDAATVLTPGRRAKLTGLQAEMDFRSNDTAQAVTKAQDALASVPTANWGNWVGGTLASLVLAHTAAGESSAATTVLRNRVPESLFDTRYGLRYLYARGHHYLAIGDHLAGLADFLRCGRLMNTWGIDRTGLVRWRLAVAAAYSGMNNYGKAVEHIDETVDRLETSTIDHEALPAAESAAERRAALRESIFEVLRDTVGTPALISEIERRQNGAPIEEKFAFTPRYKIYDRHADYLNKLSPSERRVATLAAKGLTNQKIARELSVTVSTVEQHLTRTYKKLGLSGRNELQAKLG